MFSSSSSSSFSSCLRVNSTCPSCFTIRVFYRTRASSLQRTSCGSSPLSWPTVRNGFLLWLHGARPSLHLLFLLLLQTILYLLFPLFLDHLPIRLPLLPLLLLDLLCLLPLLLLLAPPPPALPPLLDDHLCATGSPGSARDLICTHFSDGMSELAIAYILLGMLRALEYIHHMGYVHR